MERGRPSKYDPKFCDAVIEHCQDGASLASFAASVRVARSTLNQWAEDHPEFSEALAIAKTAAGAWYDKQARIVAVDGGGNAALIKFGLSNFNDEDFKEKIEQHHTGGVTVEIVRFS